MYQLFFFKSLNDFNRDQTSYILNLLIPLIIGIVVGFIWRNNDFQFALYVAYGYLSWDFTARCLLDGERFYKKIILKLNLGIDLKILFLEDYFSNFLKFCLSLLTLLILSNVSFVNLFISIIFIFIFSFFLYLFTLAISFNKYASFLIKYYSRLGLFISPIFWNTDSNLLLLNPSFWIMDTVRFISSLDLKFENNQIIFFFVFIISILIGSILLFYFSNLEKLLLKRFYING